MEAAAAVPRAAAEALRWRLTAGVSARPSSSLFLPFSCCRRCRHCLFFISSRSSTHSHTPHSISSIGSRSSLRLSEVAADPTTPQQAEEARAAASSSSSSSSLPVQAVLAASGSSAAAAGSLNAARSPVDAAVGSSRRGVFTSERLRTSSVMGSACLIALWGSSSNSSSGVTSSLLVSDDGSHGLRFFRSSGRRFSSSSRRRVPAAARSLVSLQQQQTTVGCGRSSTAGTAEKKKQQGYLAAADAAAAVTTLDIHSCGAGAGAVVAAACCCSPSASSAAATPDKKSLRLNSSQTHSSITASAARVSLTGVEDISVFFSPWTRHVSSLSYSKGKAALLRAGKDSSCSADAARTAADVSAAAAGTQEVWGSGGAFACQQVLLQQKCGRLATRGFVAAAAAAWADRGAAGTEAPASETETPHSSSSSRSASRCGGGARETAAAAAAGEAAAAAAETTAEKTGDAAAAGSPAAAAAPARGNKSEAAGVTTPQKEVAAAAAAATAAAAAAGRRQATTAAAGVPEDASRGIEDQQQNVDKERSKEAAATDHKATQAPARSRLPAWLFLSGAAAVVLYEAYKLAARAADEKRSMLDILKEEARALDGYMSRLNEQLHLYLDQRIGTGKQATEPLLPDLQEINAPDLMPTLVLNFDNVLAHISYDPVKGYKVRKRPGVERFLSTLCNFYEIVIWSNHPFPYIEDLLRTRLEWPVTFTLHQENMARKGSSRYRDLSRLGRRMDRILYIDTEAASLPIDQKENFIRVPAFHGEAEEMLHDHALEDVTDLLISAAVSAGDVRLLLRRYGGGEDGDVGKRFLLEKQQAEKKADQRRSIGRLFGFSGARQLPHPQQQQLLSTHRWDKA